jgi:hypothetical protein
MSPSIRIRSIAKWAVVPVALMASGLLVWQSSYSAFSATAVNPSSNWTAGTVVLTDDDSNAALFTASALKPGDTGSKCIVVTSSGNLASTVKLYGAGYTTSSDTLTPFAAFGTHLNMIIDEGTGGSNSSCTGFSSTANDFTGTLAAFASGKTSFANGVSTWAPAAGTVTKTFKFTYTLDAATPNGAQAGTSAIGFTWEAQNS